MDTADANRNAEMGGIDARPAFASQRSRRRASAHDSNGGRRHNVELGNGQGPEAQSRLNGRGGGRERKLDTMDAHRHPEMGGMVARVANAIQRSRPRAGAHDSFSGRRHNVGRGNGQGPEAQRRVNGKEGGQDRKLDTAKAYRNLEIGRVAARAANAGQRLRCRAGGAHDGHSGRRDNVGRGNGQGPDAQRRLNGRGGGPGTKVGHSGRTQKSRGWRGSCKGRESKSTVDAECGSI